MIRKRRLQHRVEGAVQGKNLRSEGNGEKQGCVQKKCPKRKKRASAPRKIEA